MKISREANAPFLAVFLLFTLFFSADIHWRKLNYCLNQNVTLLNTVLKNDDDIKSLILLLIVNDKMDILHF